MSKYFLWGGLTAFVALSPINVFAGLTFAGLLMVIGIILLIFGK